MSIGSVLVKGSSIVYPYRIPKLYGKGGDITEPDYIPTSKYYNKIKGIQSVRDLPAYQPKLSGKINTKINIPKNNNNNSIRYSKLDSIIPYASNIVNGFRRLPSPIPSQMESSISPNLVNLDAARNSIDIDQRNLNRETDYRVSNPAVAQAIKATTFGKSILGKNQLAQEEANTNAQIKNQTNQFNQGIQVRNIDRQNQFNNNLVGRNIAQQNLQSENLANIGDKYQEQTRDKSLMDLENRKLSYLPEFYEKGNNNESIFDRLQKRHPSEEGYKELGGDIKPTPIQLIKERTHKRDSVRNLLNNKFPKNYKKVNDGMLDYFQTEPEEYKNIKVYSVGGEIDPNKSVKPKANDFTLQPWSKQGVMDSTGRVPMYKTTNSAFYNLTKSSVPEGVNPNDEIYTQIPDLEKKLNPILNGAKPISTFANDIYGDPALVGGQGRVVSDQIRRKFATGGGIHIKPENRGKFNALKARTGKTTEELKHSKNPLTRKRATFALNASHWNKK